MSVASYSSGRFIVEYVVTRGFGGPQDDLETVKNRKISVPPS
jgi:hypothetical protein